MLAGYLSDHSGSWGWRSSFLLTSMLPCAFAFSHDDCMYRRCTCIMCVPKGSLSDSLTHTLSHFLVTFFSPAHLSYPPPRSLITAGGTIPPAAHHQHLICIGSPSTGTVYRYNVDESGSRVWPQGRGRRCIDQAPCRRLAAAG